MKWALKNQQQNTIVHNVKTVQRQLPAAKSQQH